MPTKDPIEAVRPVYEKMLKIRASKTVTLKPNPLMRTTIEGLQGQPEPFNLRYYQVQGVWHLMVMPNMILGDGTGLGKTVEMITALCYLWATKEPDNMVIVVAPKSALRQWAEEIRRFTLDVQPIIAVGTLKQRKEAYKRFFGGKGRRVLLLNYNILCRDWVHDRVRPLKPNGKPDPNKPVVPGLLDGLTDEVKDNLVVVFDEASAFKNMRTKTWEVCRYLADRSRRAYGLTATMLKNNLMEGFSIFKCIRPEVFTTKTDFLNTFCVVKMQPTSRGMKIPIVIGYRNLELFRSRIDPFFLGRPKHAVSDELPTLTTKEIRFQLNRIEDTKYREALSGLLELGDGELKDYEEHKAFVSLIYCQQVVNSLAMLRFKSGDEILDGETFDGVSSKEQELIDLLTEELDGEKVIIYTRFESHVARLQKHLTKAKIKSARITGKDKDDVRRRGQKAFQDFNNPTRVMFITDAGSEAINLQAASAMIFYDSPWSWGNYVQCLDTQTEVLTRRGFLGHTEIRNDDLVAALDPETGNITWQPIRSKVLRPLAPGEEIYAIQSPHVDIRVTGGHRMLFQRQTSDRHKNKVWPKGWRFQTAQGLSCERSVYRIPVGGMEHATGLPVTDAELRFIGWFLTDGGFNKATGQVEVTQAEHQPQIEDLRRCLADCGFDWKEYPRDPSKIKGSFPNGKPQIRFVVPKGTGRGSRKRSGWSRLAPYLDKDFAPALEALDSRQLGVLLEAIHLGDGAKQLGQTWTRRSYHVATGSEVFADRLQSLCIRRGYRCNLSKPKGYTLHIKREPHWTLMGAPSQKRPRLQASPAMPGEMVWCVENDVGTLVTRRNGKVVIMGNCIGRMIRIGSPHKGVLVYHLVSEKSGDKPDTIDGHVLKMLRRKKNLIDRVIGEAAVGALDFDERVTKDLLRRMQGRANE